MADTQDDKPRPTYVATIVISDDGSWPRIPAHRLWSNTTLRLPEGLSVESVDVEEGESQ